MRCPICFSKNTQYFAEKNQYVFYRCTLCKALFLPTLPSPKKLNAYYASHFSYVDGLKNEAIIRKRSTIILKKIHSLAPKAKSICDVGSGYGFFLDCANRAGYKTTGIEPAKELAHHANTKYKINVFHGDLEQYVKRRKKQFDIVTCIHVIEHVYNPKIFLTSLLKLVKPGGLLFIETPNSDSHLLYAERERYTFLIPPDHLWLFSKESLKHLLPKNTDTILINTYSYSEHLMGIIKQMKKNTSIFRNIEVNRRVDTIHKPIKQTNSLESIRKKIFYCLFDKTLAPLFTCFLNLYHKGSILELYIKKKDGKSGL